MRTTRFLLAKKRLALFAALSLGPAAAYVMLAPGAQTTRDAITAAGAHASSANYRTVDATGQFSPPGRSASANYRNTGGFLGFLDRIVARGQVLARALCPASFVRSCSISVRVEIDVSGVQPPAMLGSFTGSLRWDPLMLEFAGHSGLQSGFIGLVNTGNVDAGELLFNGTNTAGRDGNVPVLEVLFKAISPVDSSGQVVLDFAAIAAAKSFESLLPLLDIDQCVFSIADGDVLGDINGDGAVNSTDALAALTFDVGLPLPDREAERIAAGIGDVNGDSATNSTDALLILSFELGIPVPFALGTIICP
jgi:hypothetical protein